MLQVMTRSLVAPALLALSLCAFGATACSSTDGADGSSSDGIITVRAGETKHAICVQPGRYATSDAIAVDRSEGGKTWERHVSAEPRTHEDAVTYCSTLILEGQRDFRLPTTEELQSLLLNPGRLKQGPEFCSPAIDQVAFPGTPPDWFWSSNVRSLGDVLYTGFADGRTHASEPETRMYVRCVKD